MNEKRNRIKSKRSLVISIVAVAVLAVATTVAMTSRNKTDAAASVKPAVGAAVTSQFAFTGSTGWWQGATNKTSMAVFQDTHSCFVSAEHKTGTVDAVAKLQKIQSSLASQGYMVTPGNIQTLILQTAAGQQRYELHQSTVTTPKGSNKVEGGQEFGYVQLSDGYIKIMGYCDTADELPATIPVLRAIKFNETK
jgi:hypothetical protein